MTRILGSTIPSYEFERDIDWRIRILDAPLEIYAESVEYPPSDIEMVEDGLGIDGSFKSVIKTPELTATIYADSGRILESYLVEWAESQYNEETGAIAAPFDDDGSTVKIVYFDRLSNVDVQTVLTNLLPGATVSAFTIVPEESKIFKCYLTSMPKFVGGNDPDFRRLQLQFTPISPIKPFI